LSGLTPGTQYAICLVATNASGETVGNTLTFMTPPSASPPEAPITGSCPGPFVEGRVCGTLNPNSSAKVGYYFAYNAGSDCHGGSEAPGGGEMEGEAIAVDAELSGLTPGTRYAVCLVATNGSGDTFGNAVHFATRPDESPPQAPITEACGASSAVGTVCGTLNPNSSAKVGYYFAYNLGSDCLDGSRTAPQPEVEGKGIQVSEPLSGLTAGAEYSVCLVATNAFGETPGEVLSLKVPSSRGGGDTGSGGGGSATTGGAGSGPTPATDNPSPTTGNCGALPAGARSTCLRLKKELAKAAGAGRRCRKLATPWARRRCTARAHRRHRHLYTRYEKLIG
jgi:hypothetical protein